jgi:predicted ATP-grasp superfamily ATP-dependent carboligase
MTAIVFNCHYNGFSILQTLGRNDIETISLDSSRTVGTFSRYTTFRPCTNPKEDEVEFINQLTQIGEEHETKPVIIPTNDEWAAAVSKSKEQLSEYFEVCVADWQVVKKILEKNRFYDWANQKGYPVPVTWRMNEGGDIPASKFPVAAKPRYRRLNSSERDTEELGDQEDGFRLKLLNSAEEMKEFRHQYQNVAENIIFQEYIPGMADRMFTVGIYADRDSDIRGIFTGKKVRGFPPDIGDCNLGQEHRVPESVVETVREIVNELNYTGLAEFEFKRHATTEDYRLIEINPRSWSWIGITPRSGVNLPLLAYQDLRGKEIPALSKNDPSAEPVAWIRLFEDVQNCLLFNEIYGFDQHSMGPVEWWKDVRNRDLVIAEFSADDPVPTVYSAYLSLRSMAAKTISVISSR